MSRPLGCDDAGEPQASEPEGETAGPARRRRGVLTAAVLVGLAAAGLVAVLATRDTAGGRIRVASPLIGQQVPPLAGEVVWPLDRLAAAESAAAMPGVRVGADALARFDIDAAAGRWVLVNFFASWCVPCEREHPALEQWALRHAHDGAIVAVPFGDRTADAIAFYERLGGAWPVVDDPDARWAVAFGVLRPPETFLITPTGVVAARWQGQITADDPDAVIELLSGAAAATPSSQPAS